MNKVSPFLQPLLWMLIGPPAFRIASDRSALASVEGDQDIWNIIRLVWWLAWGGIALLSLIRSRDALGPRWHLLGSIPAWAGVWLASVFVSSVFSPSPEYTLASATMMLMILLAGMDLAMKVSMNRIDIDRLVHAVLYVSAGMLSLVGILYLTVPEMMSGSGWTYSGHRIRGEGIAYTPIVAQMTIFCGIYLASISSGKRRMLMLAFVMYGLWWIQLAQTRSAYITILLGVTLMLWHRYHLKTKLVHLMAVVATVVACICVITFMYDTVHGVQWRLDKMYDRYVLRDEFAIENQEAAAESLASLNGRTDAQAVLLKQALKRPLGMGYVAGTREYMASVVDELPSEAFHGAHNAYLEIMSGAGFGAIFGFLLLIAATIKRGRTVTGPASVLFRVALYTILLEALVESNLAFPFHQSLGYFWIMMACLLGLFMRKEMAQGYASRVEAAEESHQRLQPRVANGW